MCSVPAFGRPACGLPDNLHRMLKQAAETSGWTLKTEIVTRLQNSLRGRP